MLNRQPALCEPMSIFARSMLRLSFKVNPPDADLESAAERCIEPLTDAIEETLTYTSYN